MTDTLKHKSVIQCPYEDPHDLEQSAELNCTNTDVNLDSFGVNVSLQKLFFFFERHCNVFLESQFKMLNMKKCEEP